MRRRTIFDKIFLSIGSNITGRRLVTGPLVLPGFCKDTSMPSPNSSSISFSKASLRVSLMASNRVKGPYFTISADILSIPGVLLLFSLLMPAATSSIDISLFNFLGCPSYGFILLFTP